MRRTEPAAALMLAAWLALAALPCSASDLVLALTRSALSLPLHVADAQGYFAAEGVGVRLRDCQTGQQCLDQLFDGSAQLATASELPVMFNAFERADYAVVATFVTSTRNIRLVGRKSAGADAVAHLEGKRVGVILRSSAHYDLDASLLFHGIDPKHVTLVPLAPEQIVPALAQRSIDAFAAYARQATPALQALGTDGVVLDRPRIYTETFNLVADRRTLAQREPDVVRVLRALDRAQRFIAAQPQRAAVLMQNRMGLNPAAAPTLLDGFQYRLSLDQSLVSTMEGQARWALREGHVAAGRKVPNYLDFVQARPLREAVPAAVATSLER